jgi:SAM-dependent methyltransferase
MINSIAKNMRLYATTVFLSAFLLFQVQPLVAKIILPWFGGSAAVWTVCMLFFQVLLLLGYFYAHGSIRWQTPSRQRAVHWIMLAAAVAVMPLAASDTWKPHGGEDPTLRILGLLAATIGLPYLLLSTTGPLAQAWFARERPGVSPYRLFALSNLGSMLALVSYPLLVEPFAPIRIQTAAWSLGFVVFAVLCAALAWRAAQPEARVEDDAVAGAQSPGPATVSLWVALPACASVLLLAFTSHMSLNIAAIPLLWVLPLALYLLSFVLCFDAPRWYRRSVWLPLLVLGVAAVCYTLTAEHRNTDVWVLIPLYSATLLAACMACHGELSRNRPHPRHLTTYYLLIALGGALGGLLVGLLAPHVFPDLYELPLGIAALAFLVPAALLVGRTAWRPRRPIVLGAAAAAAAIALGAWLLDQYSERDENVRITTRNFYGVLKTRDSGEGPFEERILTHGTIVHGRQFLAPERRTWPTSYYGRDSGVGLAILHQGGRGPIRVGVVGLGAGTIASYGRPGDAYRFYDINPRVIELARAEFTFLADSKAAIDTVLGDARLSLEREPGQNFDVLALDAFSSDSIPVHLLTSEAFDVYLRHLRPDGILAVHVSNRYLDLVPVVQRAARRHSLEARLVESDDSEDAGTYRSDWVLLSRSAAAFRQPPLAGAAHEIEEDAGAPLWTDDYSNVLGLLKHR